MEAVAWRETEYWPVERELLAQIADTLAALVTITVNMNRKKGTSPLEAPSPTPRPGSVEAAKVQPMVGMKAFSRMVASRR